MKQTLLIVLGWLLVFNTSAANTEHVLSGLNEVKGTTTDYKIVNGDGLADFSLVIPAMNPEELVNFDMGRIFSPESDTIKILSYSMALPSNLSVPKQQESYFLSFTVEKNLFRSFLPAGGLFNMYALRGQFPIGDVIKGVQNKKSLFELVNLFSFYGGGTKNVKASGGSNVDISVDDIQFDQSFTLKAPTYKSGNVIMSLGLVKVGGEYYPTDLKRIDSAASAKLVTRSGAPQYVLSLLMNDTQRSFSEVNDLLTLGLSNELTARATTDFSQLSYTLQKVTSSTTPQLLPQIGVPQFSKTQSKVSATPPKATSGINSYATRLVLAEVEAGTGIVPVSFRQPLWSTTVMGWQTDFAIPPEAMAMIKSKKYSWDILYMGTTNSAAGTTVDWDNVTHVTRNSLTF